MTERLALGQTFPTVSLSLSDGATMTLPDDLGDSYKVIVFYRGGW